MRYLLIILVVLFIISCNSGPFIKHKLEYKKVSDNCTESNSSYKLESNIMGDRYEFNECLEENFDGKNYTVDRQGDTLLVKFPGANNKNKTALFMLKLDIDASPSYKYILFGEQLMEVNPH